MADSHEHDSNEPQLSAEQMDLLLRFGRALADSTRLRILGLLTERAMYGLELVEALHVKPPTISHHLNELRAAGLVRVRRENAYHYYELDDDGLHRIAESLFAGNLLPLPPTSDERARVLATFFKDGRLTSIPAQRKKRLYVLEELARAFEWGRLYEEREVNAILKAFHEDVASLRRGLVDERLMMREQGRYWLVRPHKE
jgi:hypothetical protein